jgi:hypothetical protein
MDSRLLRLMILLALSGPWFVQLARVIHESGPMTCCGTRGQCPMHLRGPCPQTESCACGLTTSGTPAASPAALLGAPAIAPEPARFKTNPAQPAIHMRMIERASRAPTPLRRPPRG